MAKRPNPTKTYVSPVVWASRILTRARAGERVSKPVLTSAERIQALSAWITNLLERHKAPYRVARWVAWAEQDQQQQRADLAVLVRSSRSTKGWPDAGHLKAAFGVYLQARAARLGRSTQVSDVPVDQYLAAIDALPKRPRRRRADKSDAPHAIVAEDDVLRALVEARPPKRRRPPMLKLRTTPLRTGNEATPTATLASDVDRLLTLEANNTQLRAQRRQDELEAIRGADLHRREIAKLTAKIETLERERSDRSSSGTSPLVVLGSAVTGAVMTELVRRGAELLADNTRSVAPATGATSALDGEQLLTRLLPVFDNLVRAHHHAEQGGPATAITDGLRMVLAQLDEALARSGVERVPSVGQLFDPRWHAAVEHVEAPEPAGTVLREVLPGYSAGGRLLRAASVVVSKGRGTAEQQATALKK